MRAEELGATLRDMYGSADEGEAVAMIHLFAIKYAREIRNCDSSPKDIARLAGISETYGTEINKGIKLERYVTPKP